MNSDDGVRQKTGSTHGMPDDVDWKITSGTRGGRKRRLHKPDCPYLKQAVSIRDAQKADMEVHEKCGACVGDPDHNSGGDRSAYEALKEAAQDD